jgi:hypothetical protein
MSTSYCDRCGHHLSWYDGLGFCGYGKRRGAQRVPPESCECSQPTEPAEQPAVTVALSWADWGKLLLSMLASIALTAVFALYGIWELDKFTSPGGDLVDLLCAIVCVVFAVCSGVVTLFVLGAMMVVVLSSALDKL